MVPLSPLSFYFTVASTKAVLIPRIKAQEERQEILHLRFSFFFFKIFFFLMWTIFKVFIEFVTILLLFNVLVFWP